jgi:hypothetical protein
MITWHLGGAVSYPEELLKYSLRLIEQGYRVQVYDAAFTSLWNGGRIPFNRSTVLDDFLRAIELFNSHGIGVDATFSGIIDEHELMDYECNVVLNKLAGNPTNGVILSEQKLFNHIKKNYPGLAITSSITSVVPKIDGCDYYAVNPDFNTHLEDLAGLGFHRLQILVNENCYQNCAERGLHYQLLSLRMKLHDKSYEDVCICKEQSGGRFKMRLDMEQIIALHEAGISHFKLQGRQEHIENEIGPYIRDVILKTNGDE